MLNKELFKDERDAEIARLKLTIEKFKEYDKERKKYYTNSLQRLGELEAYIDELDAEGSNAQSLKLLRCQTELKKLQNILRVRKIKEELTDEQIQDLINNHEYKEKLDELHIRIKQQAKTISELIQENNNLKNKIKRIEQLVKLKEDKQ